MRSFELLGVKNVMDGAWIVNRGIGEVLMSEVHYLKLLQHIVDGFCEGDMLKLFKMVEHLLCSQVFMGHFQGNHYQWDLTFLF